MRKFLAAILSVLCLTCLCLALTACVGPRYYTLTYDAIGGVNLDFGEIQSGAKVKAGYVVNFKCDVDENRVTGEPTVLINGEDEYPDLDGVYSFIMSKDTKVTVSGVYAKNAFDVNFDKEEWRIKYLDAETGKEISKLESVSAGTKIEFTLDISVYYDQNSKFNVLANTTVLNAENGVYAFTVTRNTVVKVVGLELDTPFLNRGTAGGEGTRNNPYIIERPIDLYTMADLVNDSFYSGLYGLAYYKLNADINMEGEQLFIIGDRTSAMAVFCGNFNGNNHKIYNYYISDSIIEQSEFSKVFMPYIGLFGVAAATTYGPAEIYDLTLENFTVNVNADIYDSTFAAGGIVGLGIGVNITNCSVSGKMTADADNVYYGYLGGIAGFMQSAYDSADRRAVSAVIGCSSDVDIEGQSGYLYAAGGIVGYLNTYEQNTTAYIVNSYSNGSVAGAMNAGGIAGYVNAYGSIKNCYSLGSVDAYNEITPQAGYDNYAYAYAGGIAGYVERGGVVSGCFSLADTYATAYDSQHAKSGKICGGLELGGGAYIEAPDALELNCTSNASNINESYLKGTLGWSADEWTFGNGYPVYKGTTGEKSVHVSVHHVGAVGNIVDTDVVNLTANTYLPVSEWYGEEFSEFLTDGSLRSYGYYFDLELTKKVPAGYVLAGTETLYIGFADYSGVSGIYYLQTAQNGSGIYIELKPDGSLIYRNGGINLVTYYTYDGQELTLYNSPAFAETETSSDGAQSSYYSCAKGTLENGVLTLVNNISYTEASPLRAVKKVEGFIYGGYYYGSSECIFNTDGTGSLSGVAFTYTISGNTITINGNTAATISGRTVTLAGNVYTAYDPFAGTWETSATTHEEFNFDGKNAWTYTYYKYVDGVKTEIASASGTYAYDSTDDHLTLTVALNNGTGLANNTIVSFDADGCLKVTRTDFTQPYYKPSSFAGKWRYFYKDEAIEITFNGLGTDGVGTALISYETVNGDLDITYDVQNVQGVDYVCLYLEDNVLGMLHYDVNDYTLKGMIYSYMEDMMLDSYVVYDINAYADSGELKVIATYENIVSFCLYDDFGGQWVSSEWGLIEFNGYGSYNLKSIIIREDNNYILTLPVSGAVIFGDGTGTYKLDNSTMEGTLVYGGVTYEITYNQASDTVTVKNEGNTFTLYRPDRMMGIQLAGGGKTYTFDGGSALSGGGNVTVNDGSTSTEYKYTISGTTINITGLGSITVSGDSYTLGGVTLTVINGFTGSWYVGGTLDTMVIGEIGALNTAAGSYCGENVTFEYNATEDYLSFRYHNATYYVFAMQAQDGEGGAIRYELLISTSADKSKGESVVCYGTTKQTDGFRGTYTATNGDYITFDGLSNATYGNGTAIWYINGGKQVYSYTVNRFGMVVFTVGVDENGRNIYNIVVEETAGIYSGNGKKFTIYVADRLYNVSAKNEFDEICSFDGVGTVICGDRTYHYVIDGNNLLKLAYELTLTDGNGNVYAAELGYGSSTYKLRFVDELTDIIAIDGEIAYTFTSAGHISSVVPSGTTKNYTYVIENHYDDFKTYILIVTDEEGAEYLGTLDLSKAGEYTLKLTKKS